MKLVVLGAGRMGSAAAYDLAAQEDVSEVVVVDRDHGRAEDAARRAGSKAVARSCDLTDRQVVASLLTGTAGVLSSASYTLNESLTRAAIDVGCCFVDLGGNNDVVRAQLAMDELARGRGITVIPDCGLAPGLAGWLGARLVSRLDTCEALRLRVGGLPSDRPPPLDYRLVFSVEGLINEYKEKCLVVRDGRLVEVPALTEVESLEFPPPFGLLECFHTSGGLSTLPDSLGALAAAMEYKTIRYPGHAAKIRLLFDLGLADETEIEVPGGRVAPRAVLEACLERTLSGPVHDVVLVRIDAVGHRGGKRITLRNQIVDRLDERTGHSAMARTTAYPAAIALLEAVRGHGRTRGVAPGERVLDLDRLVAQVRARGIEIEETEFQT